MTEIVAEPVDASDVKVADAGGELPPCPVSGASPDLVDELKIVVPLKLVVSVEKALLELVVLTDESVEGPPIVPRVKVDIVSVQLKLEQAKYQQTCSRGVACVDRVVTIAPVVV